MPPTMPIVSAFDSASASLTSLSPKAVPAALSKPIRIAAMPTATSQPKKADPQLTPPNSSRWRALAERAVSASASRSRAKRGRPGSAVVRVAAGSPAARGSAVAPWSRSAVAAPPPSSLAVLLLNRSSIGFLPGSPGVLVPAAGSRKPLGSGRGVALPPRRGRREGRPSAAQAGEPVVLVELRRRHEAGRLGVLAEARWVALLAAVRRAVEALDHAERGGA